MNKEYYKEVDFTLPPDSDFPAPKTGKTELPKDVTEELDKLDQEIELLQMGQSELRKGGIHFPKGQAPVLNALKVMRKLPTAENLDNLILLVKQDLGLRVARFVVDLFKEVRPEVKKLI